MRLITKMAPKQSNLSNISLLFLLFFFFYTPSVADLFSTLTSQDDICSFTPYQSFCRSNLHNINSYTIHDYGKTSLQQSLSKSQSFLSLVDYYRRLPSTLSLTTIYAIEDCRDLTELNMDYLSQTLETIKYTNSLPATQAYDLLSLMSAIITNHQTCFDGLIQATKSSIMSGLLTHLSDGTMQYSVSLALFKQGWVRDYTRKGRYLTESKHKFISISRIHRSVIKRKLLQATQKNVSVIQYVTVNPDGSGDFTTINDAVAAAPNNTDVSKGYFVIYVVAGVYEEYVSIIKQKLNLMMTGDGINKTIITGNHSVGDGWTTFNSATFAVLGRNFVAVDITFRNTAGAIKHQAVAVRNGADMSTFYRCSFEGYQDTLYAHSLRQFYRDCEIYGTVDFIFGNAAAVFQNCNIYPRLPLDNQFNAITAQGRSDPNQYTGISIHNCTIRAADDLASAYNATVKTYLGRPWKQYSRTVYMQSFMDALIDPSGWSEWSGNFALDTLYYAEFCNVGPGSNTNNRVQWSGYHVLNETDAANFTVSSFIFGDDWLPATRVPYTPGLLPVN